MTLVRRLETAADASLKVFHVGAAIAMAVVFIWLIALQIAWTVPPAFPTSGPGWRLVLDGREGPATNAWSASALDAPAYERLWRRHSNDAPPAVDFRHELVVAFRHIDNDTCPAGLTGVTVDQATGIVTPSLASRHPGRACPAIAMPHWFVVALDRAPFELTRTVRVRVGKTVETARSARGRVVPDRRPGRLAAGTRPATGGG